MTALHALTALSGVALLDGGTGTELFKLGLKPGDSPELWNIEEPEKVRSVHNSYVNAGSDILLTNSFGGTSYRLAQHSLQSRVFELNNTAAKHTREAADAAMAVESSRTVLVAGSMGPTGALIEPMGPMTSAACTAAFTAQAEGLVEGGADILWIETMSSVEEVEAAVVGVRRASDLPVCVTMSFDTAGRTLMGVTGTVAGELAARLELDAIGANCGNNLADTETAVEQMKAANPNILLISKGNARIPERYGNKLRYHLEPQVMAQHTARARDLGIHLIGACCGSTPEHINLMRQVLDGN